jgi:hypothetical protein
VFGGLRGEHWGMFRITVVENVGRDLESFVDTIEREMAGDDAVVAGKDFLDDCSRAGIELPAEVGRRKDVPTFSLRETLLGGGCS